MWWKFTKRCIKNLKLVDVAFLCFHGGAALFLMAIDNVPAFLYCLMSMFFSMAFVILLKEFSNLAKAVEESGHLLEIDAIFSAMPRK